MTDRRQMGSGRRPASVTYLPGLAGSGLSIPMYLCKVGAPYGAFISGQLQYPSGPPRAPERQRGVGGPYMPVCTPYGVCTYLSLVCACLPACLPRQRALGAIDARVCGHPGAFHWQAGQLLRERLARILWPSTTRPFYFLRPVGWLRAGSWQAGRQNVHTGTGAAGSITHTCITPYVEVEERKCRLGGTEHARSHSIVAHAAGCVRCRRPSSAGRPKRSGRRRQQQPEHAAGVASVRPPCTHLSGMM